ncbi:MAG: NlpC/P60 family protein [Gaiellaceae bacterium]
MIDRRLTHRPPLRRVAILAAAVGCALSGALFCGAGSALAAGPAAPDWAAPQIRAVTKVGVLGSSPATFSPESALTQAQLAEALQATAQLQATPPPAAPAPAPLVVRSTLVDGSTVGGVVSWQVDAPGRAIDHVDFAVDGAGTTKAETAPYVDSVDTGTLADGPHQLALEISFAGGGYAVAVLQVTVANAPGSLLPPPSALTPVAVARSWLPAATPAVPPPVAVHVAYRAVFPSRPVSIKQLDAALVGYLNLGDAARAIQTTLRQAGLQPPPNTGSEAVARMLGLRLNHPAAQDSLELLPGQPATRAEAAWSFAQILRLDPSTLASVESAAAPFTMPVLTTWQRRLLTTAISYVGYPYVWGGTSPTSETLFGVQSVGGFDCSGFVWRVVKLTPYAGEGTLADVLRGRTTYEMSGEVPRSARIAAAGLQPADVMFFGADGPTSKPSQVDHAALYLGSGWFVQSSDEGVTLLPFDGWYTHNFAWARRPLREAGLTG